MKSWIGSIELVDLLRKPTGFTREFFADFEAEKGERAKAQGIVVPESGVKVWEANDPRWLLKPPYGFQRYRLKWGGYCVYCATKIPAGADELYSRKLNSVAHRECHADFDREVPRVEVSAAE